MSDLFKVENKGLFFKILVIFLQITFETRY